MADETKTQDGRGNYGNPEEHAKAGKKGGDETAKRGSGFYSEIGSDQNSQDDNDNPGNFANRDDAAEQGRKGGQA